MTGTRAADAAVDIRILKGSPSDDDLAALVAVLQVYALRSAAGTRAASAARGDGSAPVALRIRPATAAFGRTPYVPGGSWRAPGREPP